MVARAIFTFLFIVGLFQLSVAQEIESHGVKFPVKMKINEKIVKYNGSGLREKYFFDLYVAALYLQNQTSDAKKVINADEEMCIRLKLVSDKVTREKFVETVKEGFSNSTDGKASATEINTFMGYFKKPFKVGDDIILIYKPGEGVSIIMNGEALGTQNGLEFKKALWSIWFGDKPADADLKKGMLGKV